MQKELIGVLLLALTCSAQTVVAPKTVIAPKTAISPATSGGSHSFTVVHSYTGGSSTGGNTYAPISITATTAGSGFIITFLNNDSAGTPTTPSCSPTCSVLVSDNTNYAYFAVIAPSNLPTGTTTIDVTVVSGGAYTTVYYAAAEVAGISTAGTVDVQSASTFSDLGTGGGSATNFLPSVTTTYANDVILGAAYVPENAGTATAGTNDTFIANGAANYGMTLLEQKTSITSTEPVTYQPGMTWTPTYAQMYGATIALELQ